MGTVTKRRRKRNRKKKTKTSSDNNGTEAKKTAPTPAAASATSAPAAKLAKKGKGVNAKDVVSALKTTVCDFCTLFYRLDDTISNYPIRFLSRHFHFLFFSFLFFSFPFVFPCYMVS